MTRETKIGLLVGLAFIIVIGILLSDHLTSSNEPPQAALTGAGSGVRQAVNSPGSGGAGAPANVVTPIVTPQQQVATQHELTPAPTPVIVRIGPATPAIVPLQPAPSAPTPKTTGASAVADGDPLITSTPRASAGASTAQNPAPPTNEELARVAEAHGEPLVGVGDNSKPVRASTDYVVQQGDSLSKIASKLLGSSSRANIDLIVKANPSLHGDPNKIVAGKTYQIPTAAAARAAAAATPPVDAIASHDADDAIARPASATDTHVTKPAAADATAYLYTVQAGDTLTRIAREQVGDVHAIAAIQELNGDTLKGAKKDLVILGTKLRLPGKPLAKAD